MMMGPSPAFQTDLNATHQSRPGMGTFGTVSDDEDNTMGNDSVQGRYEALHSEMAHLAIQATESAKAEA